MQPSDVHFFNIYESVQNSSSSRQPFLWIVICCERHDAGERWYILLLGGAKLKFVLATAQNIPKAHWIKYFSLLKKLKVEFTFGAAVVCIQYWAMQSKLRDLWASYHTSMKQESLLEGCLIGICLDKYAQPSWSGTELNSVPVGIFWLHSLQHISVAVFMLTLCLTLGLGGWAKQSGLLC